MAERLVEFAPIWLRQDLVLPMGRRLYEGCIHRAVTTLTMLVIAAKGHTFPETTKTTLVGWLDTWAAYDSRSLASMTHGNNLPIACATLSNLLKHAVALKSLIKQRRHVLKCIDVCAWPICPVETNLKTCSR